MVFTHQLTHPSSSSSSSYKASKISKNYSQTKLPSPSTSIPISLSSNKPNVNSPPSPQTMKRLHMRPWHVNLNWDRDRRVSRRNWISIIILNGWVWVIARDKRREGGRIRKLECSPLSHTFLMVKRNLMRLIVNTRKQPRWAAVKGNLVSCPTQLSQWRGIWFHVPPIQRSQGEFGFMSHPSSSQSSSPYSPPITFFPPEIFTSKCARYTQIRHR